MGKDMSDVIVKTVEAKEIGENAKGSKYKRWLMVIAVHGTIIAVN